MPFGRVCPMGGSLEGHLGEFKNRFFGRVRV